MPLKISPEFPKRKLISSSPKIFTPMLMRYTPKHIAIIPDGNRRWARVKKIAPWRGHQAGAEQFRVLCKNIFKKTDIQYLTFWAGSEDNLRKRSRTETTFLMFILRRELERIAASGDLQNRSIRFRMIGRWKELLHGTNALAKLANALEEQTRSFHKRNLTILFGYDGKREMIEAMTKLMSKKCVITSESIQRSLWTGDLPPVDLVIRTGGEPHWSSGFMMWHTADSQLYFTETLWPDFDEKELQKALAEYSKRERRFGK